MKQEEIDKYLLKISDATGESVEEIKSKCKRRELSLIRKSIAVKLCSKLTIRQLAKLLNRSSFGGIHKMMFEGGKLLSVRDSQFMQVYDRVKTIEY